MRKQIIHPRTAAINQKQKNHSKKCRLDALHWLQSRFPAAFDNRTQIRPLNVGIMNEILGYAEQTDGLGISKSKLREAVVLYTLPGSYKPNACCSGFRRPLRYH